MIKVLPIQGMDAYWAVQAYIKLMIGLTYLPAYLGSGVDEIFEKLNDMPFEDRKKMVNAACNVVTLHQDELLALMRFATDVNKVPYGRENVGAMSGWEIMNVVKEVSYEIAREFDLVNFLTRDEKKN